MSSHRERTSATVLTDFGRTRLDRDALASQRLSLLAVYRPVVFEMVRKNRRTTFVVGPASIP